MRTRKKRSEILDRQEELLEKIEAVDSVKAMLEAYNCNIDDLKERLEDEMDAATDEYQEHTKEEITILAKNHQGVQCPPDRTVVCTGLRHGGPGQCLSPGRPGQVQGEIAICKGLV